MYVMNKKASKYREFNLEIFFMQVANGNQNAQKRARNMISSPRVGRMRNEGESELLSLIHASLRDLGLMYFLNLSSILTSLDRRPQPFKERGG